MATFIIALHVISSIGLVGSIVAQSGKSAGLSGAIAGGAETFMGGKKKGLDDLLGKATVVFAVLFLLSALGLSLI
ncbi:preprotein translocase subunit SecG [Heliorestis convoluta]|uniref:Protein-export membrane protein SecG n=1 Tax=Heliorestis convoluta TaxID=356322 RepID=A0A5Q2MXY1_9FIRM|nr:preprotein translocase subunit SecG [Heliorestis convoluta]QGG46223.1 preprotein translocase subunit SecG [Heliorestis convoluta]